jgi:sec-independent protein translocase protein TatA
MLKALDILFKLKDAKDWASFATVSAVESIMLGIGVWELTIIFAIVLVLFGGKRLPEVATGLGQAINNFRQALKSTPEESQNILSEKNSRQKTPNA